MTFMILEHDKFLQSRAAFHAYRTKLAYSNLAIRRIYLSSRVLVDRDTALWGVGHELGHFMIRDGVEGLAKPVERLPSKTAELHVAVNAETGDFLQCAEIFCVPPALTVPSRSATVSCQ